jgi:hypothetical protein
LVNEREARTVELQFTNSPTHQLRWGHKPCSDKADANDAPQEAQVKLNSIMITTAAALALGIAAPQPSYAQATTPTSGVGTSQAGSGSGVKTDPATQGTTDRVGQTPQVPAGTSDQQPSGSVGVDPHAGTKSGEEHRDQNADPWGDAKGNDRDKTIDRNTGAKTNEADQKDPNKGDNQTPATRQGTSGTGTIGASDSGHNQQSGATGTSGTKSKAGKKGTSSGKSSSTSK